MHAHIRLYNVFFGEKQGVATRLCSAGLEEAKDIQDDVQRFQSLQSIFSYFLKDICSLWESWMPWAQESAIVPQASAPRGWKMEADQVRHILLAVLDPRLALGGKNPAAGHLCGKRRLGNVHQSLPLAP
jgi:hypothetical protein